jgi:hypothetical protein
MCFQPFPIHVSSHVPSGPEIIARVSQDAMAGSCPFVFREELSGYFCAADLLSFLLAVLTRVEAIWVALSRLGILCERRAAA